MSTKSERGSSRSSTSLMLWVTDFICFTWADTLALKKKKGVDVTEINFQIVQSCLPVGIRYLYTPREQQTGSIKQVCFFSCAWPGEYFFSHLVWKQNNGKVNKFHTDRMKMTNYVHRLWNHLIDKGKKKKEGKTEVYLRPAFFFSRLFARIQPRCLPEGFLSQMSSGKILQLIFFFFFQNEKMTS